MKKLLKALSAVALSLSASCALLQPADTITVQGAVGRQLERILVRYETYVVNDPGLDDAEEQLYLDDAGVVRQLAMLPQIQRLVLGQAYDPVASRHDLYVMGDVSLDPLDRDTYLLSSDQLRLVFGLQQVGE